MITSSSKCLIDGLTKYLPVWEDHGWIGIQNKEFIKKATAMLRIHGGNTRFQKAERREPGLASVLHSAEEGLEEADTTNIDLAVPENLK